MEIFAHRGSSGTFPENTLAAFKDAASLPITGVELDVQLTKDGEIVVIHDETIDRTSSGIGFVRDFTLDELKAYDFGSYFSLSFRGEKIPLLAEVLDVFKHTNHLINIELKTNKFRYEGIEEKVAQLIAEKEMGDRVIISSFHDESVQLFKEIAPEIPTAFLSMKKPRRLLHHLRSLGVDACHIPYTIAEQRAFKKVIAKGYPIRAFTVNQVEYMQKLEQLGVQSIITDFPEKMLAYQQNK